MYKAILVPLDGSSTAEHALRPAATLARRARSRIHLAHVEPEAAGGDFDINLAEIEPSYLRGVAERLRDAGIAEVSVEEATGSDVATRLERLRVSVGAELTVMASHGRGPVERAWLGSVADRFVRHTEAPVLLVRATDEALEEDLATDIPLDKVLVPLDGSTFSEAALGPATELSGEAQPTYVLLRVIDPPHTLGSPWLPNAVSATERQLGKARETAEAELASTSRAFADRGYAVESVAEFGNPVAQAILDVAERSGADVIAIATHGRSGVPRALMGSVTDKVLRGTDHPVLVVRPHVA